MSFELKRPLTARCFMGKLDQVMVGQILQFERAAPSCEVAGSSAEDAAHLADADCREG